LATRKGPSLIGMAVIDPDGIELGYVSAEEENYLVLGEGSAGLVRLGRRYIGSIGDKVNLTGTLAEIFAGLNVVDNEGEFVGVVRDTVEGEDSLDALIVEDEQGEMVNVAIEDVRAIDEWVDLKVSGDDLEG
jgi:sporulation protein YlmC with PRC-barrel domain